MTSPVAPTSPPAVPEFPQMGDPAFNTKAFTFGTAMPALVAWIAAAIANAWNNAISSKESADAALLSAVSAGDASAVALGAANFKGIWSNMSGALNKPASVKHMGRFWLLLNNLPNVAASEPGETADWTSLDAGQVTARISSNTNAVAGVYYIATAGGITLSYVTGEWSADDSTGGRNLSGADCFLSWGAYPLLDDGVQAAPMKWPTRGKFAAVYDGSVFA